MIVNLLSAKSISILLAVCTASTTGYNIRSRKSHKKQGSPATSNLRASSAFAASAASDGLEVEGKPAGAAATARAMFELHPMADAPSPMDVDSEALSNLDEDPFPMDVDSGALSNLDEDPLEGPPSLAESDLSTLGVPYPPYIDTDVTTFLEGDDITLFFSVGSPSHPYFSSPKAPSQSVDQNYGDWSIGLFMRDADPQGGNLAPLVSINICEAQEIEGNDCSGDFEAYLDQVAIFGSDFTEMMEGKWPLEVSDYGTGFDAYVLDGHGAAAVGPLEFKIVTALDEDEDTNQGGNSYRPLSSPTFELMGAPSGTAHMNYNRGIIEAARELDDVNDPQSPDSPSILSIEEDSGYSMYADTDAEEASAPEQASMPSMLALAPEEASAEQASLPSMLASATSTEGRITTDKDEYEYDDSVSMSFEISKSPAELSDHKIGIYMRMANVQDGSLEPVVSIPLCPEPNSSSCRSVNGKTEGSVVFDTDLNDDPNGSGYLVKSVWPIDLYEWGTGYDAYILDGSGEDVVGPVQFIISMGE